MAPTGYAEEEDIVCACMKVQEVFNCIELAHLCEQHSLNNLRKYIILKIQRKKIIIVASSDIRYLYFRNIIQKFFSEDDISSTIYHSLDELEDEWLYNGKRIVFCDNQLYYLRKDTKKTKIVPISIENVEKTIYESINDI
ncbi:hypothetical protein SFB97_11530 [Enterococcus hirae]|uniref:hypothetical protein n=1 Tax=Enterococcus hirae TaxID=1354 RepID=UPI003982327F